VLARCADVSHSEEAAGTSGWDDGRHERLSRLAKLNIELDRSLAAREAGFETALLKLLRPGQTAKSDLLVGACAARRPGWAAAVRALAELPLA
jgi:hypothetical protein